MSFTVVRAWFMRRAPRGSAPSLEACVAGAAATVACGMFVLAALPGGRLVRWVTRADASRPTPVAAAWVRPPPGDNFFGPDKDTDLGNGSPGKRHLGAEGRIGSPRASREYGLYGLKGREDEPDPHLARRLAEEAAPSAGMLAILRGSHVASVFGRHTAIGHDANDALGGLVGLEIEEARGAGGLALVGTGPAGRGVGEATIGLTNCGSIFGKGGG